MDKRKYIYFAFPLFIALVILYLCCLIPPSDIPEIHSAIPIDKVVHFTMYVALSGACFFAYIHLSANSNRFNRIIALLWCILVPALFGGFIEIIQAKYCPGRTGDWFDFLADSLGVVFVIPFAILYKRFLLKKRERKD